MQVNKYIINKVNIINDEQISNESAVTTLLKILQKLEKILD